MKRFDFSPPTARLRGGTSAGAIRAPATGPGAWLRRMRLRLAVVLAAVLVMATLVSDVSFPLMILVAIAVGVFHVQVGRRLPSYAAVQVSWIVAFALLVAAVFVPLVTTVLTLAVVLAVVGLIFVMLRLGDRA